MSSEVSAADATPPVVYSPHLGSVRPNGNLRIPLRKRLSSGETGEGVIEVGPEHPSYDEWRRAISQKEQHLAALREERMQARAALRDAAEQKRMLRQAER